MHVDGAVARAREAVAEPEIRALTLADERRERLNGGDVASGDRRGPLRRARAHVRLELGGDVGVTRKIVAIRLAVAEQAMHDRAGERRVGARSDQHREIGLLHGAVAVDVDRHDLRPALFSRAGGVRHHVDLGVDDVGAPDHDQIGFRHLARIGAGEPAGAG